MTAPARREQLLDVTAELVIEHGFPAVTIQLVASRADVSRAIVYEHFGDLGSLLHSLVEREMSRALDQLAESPPLEVLPEGGASQLLLERMRSFLRVVQRHPRTWRLVLMPPEGAPELLRKSIIRGRAAIIAGLAQALQPGLTPAGLSNDPELTARILSAISDEYARLLLADPSHFPPHRLLEHASSIIDLLLPIDGPTPNGLAPTASRTT